VLPAEGAAPAPRAFAPGGKNPRAGIAWLQADWICMLSDHLSKRVSTTIDFRS